MRSFLENIKVPIALLFVSLFPYNSGQCQTKVAETTTNNKVLVLTIDGGGIKGIIPAFFLTQLEKRFAKDSLQIYQLFDVIGGTSTGGMLALTLTTPFQEKGNKPKSTDDILDMYENHCDDIFHKTHRLFKPTYYAEIGLEPYLVKSFTAKKTLAEASNTLKNKKVQQVFTTSLLVNSEGNEVTQPNLGKDYGPYLFNWYDAKRDSTQNYYLWEAARATSAAPLYYPLANVGGGKDDRSNAKEKWAIDGGIMSNDPALWGVSEALRTKIAGNLDEIVIISLGCGIHKANAGLAVKKNGKNHGKGQSYGFWGDLKWGFYKLFNLSGQKTPRSDLTVTSLYANQFTPEVQLQGMQVNTKLRYFRFQPEIQSDLNAMDKCQNVQKLLGFIENYIQGNDCQKMLNDIENIIRKNL